MSDQASKNVATIKKLNGLFEETIVGALVEDFTFNSSEEVQEAIDHLIHRLTCLSPEGLYNDE